MNWRDHEPKYIPRYTWLRLLFRWEKALNEQNQNSSHYKAERERLRLHQIENEIEKEAEKVHQEEEERRRQEKEKMWEEAREAVRQSLLEKQESPPRPRPKVPQKKQNNRQRIVLSGSSIQEVNRHIWHCGTCQRSKTVCWTARHLMEMVSARKKSK